MNDRKINSEDVKKLYDNMSEIWPADDMWYLYTYKKIDLFLKKYVTRIKLKEDSQILNAGSGGNTYNVNGNHLHIDITDKHIKENQKFIKASIENIPIECNIFDLCICVGSVINYCDAFKAISEISRTLKVGGYLILEYDQSKNFEYYGTKTYNSNIDIVKTFNSGYEDKIWVYSEKYIKKILKHYNFKILNTQYFHCLSSLIYKVKKNEQFAAKFTYFDNITNFIPFLRKISNNIILIAQKI